MAFRMLGYRHKQPKLVRQYRRSGKDSAVGFLCRKILEGAGIAIGASMATEATYLGSVITQEVSIFCKDFWYCEVNPDSKHFKYVLLSSTEG